MVIRIGGFDGNEKGDVMSSLWQTLIPDLCEPVQWVDRKDWDTTNSYVDSLQKTDKVDMIGILWAITTERMEKVKYSYVVKTDNYVFDIPSPRLVVDDRSEWMIPKSTLSVFSFNLWLPICLTLFALVMLNAVCRLLPHTTHIGSWHWMAHFTAQSTRSEEHSSSPSLRCVLVLTSLLTVHSLMLYQGCLLSTLMRPSEFRPPFETIGDVAQLIADKHARIDLKERAKSFTKLVMGSNRGDFINLRESLQLNPALYSKDDATPYDGNQLIITATSEYNFQSAFDRDACNQTMIPTELNTLFAFPLSPNISSTHQRCIDGAIERNLNRIQLIYDSYKDMKQHEYDTCRKDLFEVNDTFHLCNHLEKNVY